MRSFAKKGLDGKSSPPCGFSNPSSRSTTILKACEQRIPSMAKLCNRAASAPSSPSSESATLGQYDMHKRPRGRSNLVSCVAQMSGRIGASIQHARAFGRQHLHNHAHHAYQTHGTSTMTIISHGYAHESRLLHNLLSTFNSNGDSPHRPSIALMPGRRVKVVGIAGLCDACRVGPNPTKQDRPPWQSTRGTARASSTTSFRPTWGFCATRSFESTTGVGRGVGSDTTQAFWAQHGLLPCAGGLSRLGHVVLPACATLESKRLPKTRYPERSP